MHEEREMRAAAGVVREAVLSSPIPVGSGLVGVAFCRTGAAR